MARREDLVEKISPENNPACVARAAAVLSYVLDQDWADLSITWLNVSSSGRAVTNLGDLGPMADIAFLVEEVVVRGRLTTEERNLLISLWRDKTGIDLYSEV